MKAVRIHAAGGLRLHDAAVPRSADGEILLRVAAVGICGSNRIRFIHGGFGDAKLSAPLVLGREFAGVIEDGGLPSTRPGIRGAPLRDHLSTHPADDAHLRARSSIWKTT